MDATGADRRTCSNCGAGLDATANFCPTCGAAQTSEPEIPEGPPPPIPEPGRIETPEVPGIPPPPPGAASPLNSLGPLKVVGIGCGAVLLIFVLLVGCLSLIGRGSQNETASVEATAEDTTEEETTKEDTRPLATGTRVNEATRGEATTAPPRTPEQRLRAAIQKALDPSNGGQGTSQDIQVQSNNGQCYDVYAKFRGDAALGSNSDYIEYLMAEVYKAAYLERELADRICTVRTEATVESTDKRGNTSRDTALITSLDKATAATLNWNNVDNIDFPSVWTVEYESDSLQQEKAQDAVAQAIDCADNGGLFDFDWLQCP